MIYWAILVLMAAATVAYGAVKVKRSGGVEAIDDGAKERFLFCALGTATFAILFYKCLAEGMKLSYTNINYTFAPFSSLGVRTAGPLLSDVADISLPSLWRVFCERNFALWDETIGLGASVVWLNVMGSHVFLFPLNYVYLLGLEYGQIIDYILKHIIGFFGLFCFMKSLKLSRIACYLGGIAYTFCSVMVMWGGYMLSYVTAFGPWLFFLVERLMQCYAQEGRLQLKYCIWFAVVLYLMLVSGMPTYVPFFLYLGIAYTFYRGFQLFGRQQYARKMAPLLLLLGGSACISVLMSFLYTGSMLFSTAEYQGERSSAGYAFSTLAINYARTIFFPYDREGLTMHPNECTVYAGPMVGFALSILLFFCKKREDKAASQLGFWSVTACVVFLLVFTRRSGHVYQFFPLINSSVKIRVLVLFCFAGSVLTALVCDGLARGTLYSKSKLKALAALMGVPIVLAFVYGNVRQNKTYYVALCAIALILFLMTWRNKKACGYLLCAVVTLNMAWFAQAWIPMIDQKAPVIPEPTDSVQCLQKELKEHNTRFVPLGAWNFFPQSSSHYKLSQLASDNFVNTDDYVRNYFTSIDPNSYKSFIKTEFSRIDNENLLSYASVEYLLSEASGLSVIDGMISESNTRRSPAAYDGSAPLEQEIIAEGGNINQLQVLLSTYAKQLSSEDVLHVSVMRKETGEALARASVRLSEVEDNKVRPIMLDRAIDCEAGERLVVRLEARQQFQLPLAIWITESSIYDGELSIGDEQYAGDLCMYSVYEDDEMFNDGERLVRLDETSPRAFFASNVLVKEDASQVLEAMKADYMPATAFITQDVAQASQIQEQANSQIAGTVSKYESAEDKVFVRLAASGSGMLVLNDYYDDDWIAYVNGEKSDVVRANYLFRGVAIPEAGEWEIEFVYRPTRFYLFAGISAAGLVMLVLLIALRKRLEAMINKGRVDL